MKPLIDLIFASEKRMSALLMLHEGPQEITTLMEALDTSRQVLLPQMKILSERHLVRRADDSYELTTLGGLIVDRMLPLTNMATVLNCEWDYLGTHYMNFIPEPLLKRIDELGTCYVVETSLSELFNVNREIIQKSRESKFYYSITSFVYPNFKELFMSLAADGVNISLMISKSLSLKLINDNYDDFQILITNPDIRFYLYPDDLDFVCFTLADHSILFRMLTLEGNYDAKQIMFSEGNAHKWGEAFFEHYRAKSIHIKDADEISSLI